jgi:two-component system cell cycle sensor histidine kinase/response regulator CckA
MTEERVATEDSLRVSEMRYRRLFETAQDGILLLDGATGAITDANPFLLKMLGYGIEDLLGKKLWDIGPFIDIAESRKAFSVLQENDYIRYEDLPLQAKNGAKIAVEFVSNAYLVNGERVIQCNIRDITERKGLEDQLRQALKMEAIGRLAGGVAHEFNNLLTVMIGYSQLMLQDATISAETHELADQVLAAAHRAEALTRQLLMFSRKKILQTRVSNLNDVVAGITKMLRRVIGDNIVLRMDYSDMRLLVDIGEGLIEQVLVNLAINARDAMPEGGHLSISTGHKIVSQASLEGHSHAVPGDFVWLRIEDTGSGMTAATQARIFEPFFTTKDIGKGTGLGLSMAYGIARQHHGWIEVTSELGVGSAFTLYLPAATEESARERVIPPVGPKLRGGNETILLVEDEPALRTMARTALIRLGYHVYEAGDGFAALDVWAQHKNEIDLLLSDMVMPEGMTGSDLALKLQADTPGLRVVLTSGYNSAGPGSLKLNEGTLFMRKPYTLDTLSEMVRSCLDSDVGGLVPTME